jgi:hypothetical protein
MIPLNPDSDKWLVTFCFWTLTYRDIGLYYALYYIEYYTVYTAYMRVPALCGTALLLCKLRAVLDRQIVTRIVACESYL